MEQNRLVVNVTKCNSEVLCSHERCVHIDIDKITSGLHGISVDLSHILQGTRVTSYQNIGWKVQFQNVCSFS